MYSIEKNGEHETAVGNAAAMREALVSVRNWCINKLGGASIQVRVEGLLSIVEDALSEPARNCDRFSDELDAQLAFLNEVWLISVDRETMLARDKYENWSDEMRTMYGKWLFAPAAERKGAVK